MNTQDTFPKSSNLSVGAGQEGGNELLKELENRVGQEIFFGLPHLQVTSRPGYGDSYQGTSFGVLEKSNGQFQFRVKIADGIYVGFNPEQVEKRPTKGRNDFCINIRK